MRAVCVLALIYFAAGCKRSEPNLTRGNFNSVIPMGMTESNVYAILGTNASVSRDSFGRKYLTYLFPYFPPPPGVNPKIDALDVMLSNSVVLRVSIPGEIHIETKPGPPVLVPGGSGVRMEIDTPAMPPVVTITNKH